MKTSSDRAAGILLIVLCFGCVRPSVQTPRTDLSIISRQQLIEHRFVSAYEAVESLRSNWLVTRGIDSFRTPSRVLVYFDNVKLGGVETLRGVSISTISYIQHFDGITATGRWGLDHGAGVIYISTHPTITRSRED